MVEEKPASAVLEGWSVGMGSHRNDSNSASGMGPVMNIEELKKRAARLRAALPNHLQLFPQVREAGEIIDGLIAEIDKLKGGDDAKKTK